MEYQSLPLCFDLEDADLPFFISIAYPCRVLVRKDEKKDTSLSVCAVDEMTKYIHRIAEKLTHKIAT